MNDERRKWLGEVRAREKAATPGPWLRKNPCGPGCEACAREDFHGAQDAIVSDRYDGEDIITCDSGVYGPALADAEFIINARTDIPKLLAEVERLEKIIQAQPEPRHVDKCNFNDVPCTCGLDEVLNDA